MAACGRRIKRKEKKNIRCYILGLSYGLLATQLYLVKGRVNSISDSLEKSRKKKLIDRMTQNFSKKDQNTEEQRRNTEYNRKHYK
jgi:hypothetical protein